jgi:hypothetical protein
MISAAVPTQLLDALGLVGAFTALGVHWFERFEGGHAFFFLCRHGLRIGRGST